MCALKTRVTSLFTQPCQVTTLTCLLLALPTWLTVEQGRNIWVSDADGDDVTGNGSPSYPFKSPFRALQEAFAGDSVFLKDGVYAGEDTERQMSSGTSISDP